MSRNLRNPLSVWSGQGKFLHLFFARPKIIPSEIGIFDSELGNS